MAQDDSKRYFYYSAIAMNYQDFDYELIDCGGCSRIERFGSLIIDRACPQALWPMKQNENNSRIFYDRTNGWQGVEKLPEAWPIQIGPLTAELRFSKNGQVGLFPEQWDNWRWIREKVTEVHRPLKILNTFSYTGMSTLSASTPNTEVVHVDGAKSAINWAKRNAELSGLDGNVIRWICDDVVKFMTREVKRDRQYDGIILDPPAFGRGAKRDWKIERDLKGLMQLVAQLLTDKPLFVILTCHAPDHFSTADFAKILENLPQFKGQTAEEIILEIPSEKGNPLPSSFGARIAY